MGDDFLQGLILFGQVAPEDLLECFLRRAGSRRWNVCGLPPGIDSTQVSKEAYLRFSKKLPANARRTEDEQIQRYHELNDCLVNKPAGGIFSLLAGYGAQVLNLEGHDPQVKQDRIFEWRDVSLAFGQDIFTCAALAGKDCGNKTMRHAFCWPPALRSDNIPLRHLLEAGCAENHYHLNGSTRVFALTWCYLMNNPGKMKAYFDSRELHERLAPVIHTHVSASSLSWDEKLRLAAWIRVGLFDWASGNEGAFGERVCSVTEFFGCPNRMHRLHSMVNVRRRHAARLQQNACGGGCAPRLDYAITKNLARCNKGPRRLLAGERSLLYRCFRRCFAEGVRCKEKMDMLYLYLLIKREFRSELIQTNGRLGFSNFAAYQCRKSILWGKSGAYLREAYILSLAENLMGDTVLRTLEARIKPAPTASAFLETVDRIDSAVDGYRTSEAGPWCPFRRASEHRKQAEEASYFYVIHFVKGSMKRAHAQEWPMHRLSERNHNTRVVAKVQAKALAKALAHSPYLCSRIRGIDACAQEIGCRPETFAPQFRYLRSDFVPLGLWGYRRRYWPKLRASYHVGEDFLDLTDGLRAVDEAIGFLNLGRGDRLGHALALGVSPSHYYRAKNWTVWLPAQDLLDNLVWVLHRSLAWDVGIPSGLREKLRVRAQQLLETIYPDEDDAPITLEAYYDAWRLRGDDPSLYRRCRFGKACGRSAFVGPTLFAGDAYARAMFDGGRMQDSTSLSTMRKSARICRILYRYHFGFQERLEGEKTVSFEGTAEFAAVLEALQRIMLQKIMMRGIAIECNPSSNCLIGGFERYEEHPIFRFNHFGLNLPSLADLSGQVRVSVNTDDQGLFDTSIENEYALLFGALHVKRNADGVPALSDDEILAYINHLRVMGRDMVFPKAEEHLR